MNLHARDIEPDLGPLLDMTDDLSAQDASGYRKTEPSLETDSRKTTGLAFGPMDRIGQEKTLPAKRPSRRNDTAAAPSTSAVLAAWGGFWRAVVIGIVSGTVGGVVGAFTLIWLTGAGWSVFAKLLVDAIGHL
ncbi:hypothetical protein [Pleomorphomonas sp. PLEO]|uniref:hypothetical protein n=1 Tax=Pleomorphomonas sp. PLEO TaxID=3239306 RepID=UPI00351E4499